MYVRIEEDIHVRLAVLRGNSEEDIYVRLDLS